MSTNSVTVGDEMSLSVLHETVADLLPLQHFFGIIDVAFDCKGNPIAYTQNGLADRAKK